MRPGRLDILGVAYGRIYIIVDPQNAFTAVLAQDRFCFHNKRELRMNQRNESNISMGRLLTSFLLHTLSITTKSAVSFCFVANRCC